MHLHGEPSPGPDVAPASHIFPVQEGYSADAPSPRTAAARIIRASAEEMVASINQASREGNLASKLKTYTAPSVLVIDDVGLLPMDRAAASAFYQVVNLRYEKQHSTIGTTNRGLPDWGEIFGDTVVAAAILDRLIHDPVVFNIKGPSWRLREHQALTEMTIDPTERGRRNLTHPRNTLTHEPGCR